MKYLLLLLLLFIGLGCGGDSNPINTNTTPITDGTFSQITEDGDGKMISALVIVVRGNHTTMYYSDNGHIKNGIYCESYYNINGGYDITTYRQNGSILNRTTRIKKL